MSYLLNTPQDQQAMLDAIGATSIDELFASIPAVAAAAAAARTCRRRWASWN